MLAAGASVALAARAASAAPTASGAPIRLGLNENPFGPSPLALRAIKDHLWGLSRYTSTEADDLVRDIAAREQVLPEQVLLGEVLEALGEHLARNGGPGGEFIYSTPGYTALVDAAQPDAGVGVPVALDASLGNDLAGLGARASGRTRALFLVNPHNPSGTVNDAAALHEFVARAAEVTTVIVDEAYLEYTPDFASRTIARQVQPGGRVIVFRTFTKFYGLAALPLHFAILPVDIAAALRKQGLGAARSQNRLAVVAARASLKDQAYAERVRRLVADERARWLALFGELGLRHSKAAASFVFFEARRPQAQLAAAFLEQGIDIGRAFPPLDDWARISIGLPEENARARATLRKLLS
jgi:histidinol-phosphate aminotransferase